MLATEADGDFEIRAIEGAVVGFVVREAGVDGVEVAFPAVTGADFYSLDLVGEAGREVEDGHGRRLASVDVENRVDDVGQRSDFVEIVPREFSGIRCAADAGLLFAEENPAGE